MDVWIKDASKDNDKRALTLHIDLYRQTLKCLNVSHHCVPHSLTVILPTVFNVGFPQSEELTTMWELLRSLEPQVTPVGFVVWNAAFQPDTLVREDPWMPWLNLQNSSEWGHRDGYGDIYIQCVREEYLNQMYILIVSVISVNAQFLLKITQYYLLTL